MNKVHFKERIIPAYTISGCWDCIHYSDNGGVDLCSHDLAPYDSDVMGDGIPDWCPLLKEQEKDRRGVAKPNVTTPVRTLCDSCKHLFVTSKDPRRSSVITRECAHERPELDKVMLPEECPHFARQVAF